VNADTQQANLDATRQADSPRNENGEPREKRQRDRYGRDRGPRGEREGRGDLRPPVAVEADAQEAIAAPAAAPSVETPTDAIGPSPAEPLDREAATAPAPGIAPTAGGMPKVASYTLPTETLLEVAQQSGLQWVNSDKDKVAAVQAAITAEAAPIHVPRERPALVVLDSGPLVLVETKRDLRNMTLPFEQPPLA
jgi:ribonuclease E